MSSNLIDIMERSQTRHALQEERELKKLHASTDGAVVPDARDKNGKSVESNDANNQEMSENTKN